MTNLKQEEIGKALIQLVNIRYLIDDGYHNKELGELIKVGNTLFEELSEENQRKFQIWLDKKMKEKEVDEFQARCSFIFLVWLTGKHFENNSLKLHTPL